MVATALGYVPGTDLYAKLRASGNPEIDNDTLHAITSVIVMACKEWPQRGQVHGINGLLGLEHDSFTRLMELCCPGASAFTHHLTSAVPRHISEEEEALHVLLRSGTTSNSELEGFLAHVLARRCFEPHHLWQDLGLRNRGELSALMNRHFFRLARRNSSDMKWKKFLYRAICIEGEHQLCSSPTCDACDDFTACFGEESGPDLLARNRREQLLANT